MEIAGRRRFDGRVFNDITSRRIGFVVWSLEKHKRLRESVLESRTRIFMYRFTEPRSVHAARLTWDAIA